MFARPKFARSLPASSDEIGPKKVEDVKKGLFLASLMLAFGAVDDVLYRLHNIRGLRVFSVSAIQRVKSL
jgi:hypothetical protein